MGSFPFANAVWQKQVTRRFDRCLLEEKQRLNADIGEKRHLYGRSQPSGEWIVEPSEETGNVWVWGHISRISGGNLRWRRLLLTSIWYFVLLETQARMCFEWRRHKCHLLWGWTLSGEVTPLILKRDLTGLAHLSATHYLHEVFSGKYHISVGCSWTIANKK